MKLNTIKNIVKKYENWTVCHKEDSNVGSIVNGKYKISMYIYDSGDVDLDHLASTGSRYVNLNNRRQLTYALENPTDIGTTEVYGGIY